MIASSPPSDEPLRERLRAALRSGMRERDAVAVAALRSALSAVDNAEAVQPTAPVVDDSSHIAGAAAGVGATEAQRRELSESDIAAIVRSEIAEHRAAADEFDALGRHDAAVRLRDQALVLSAHCASLEARRAGATLRGLPAPGGIDVATWRERAGHHDDPDAAGVVVRPAPAAGGRSVWVSIAGEPESDRLAVVWFHGGGFVVCSVETHRVLAARVAATVGGRAVVVDYPLAPETAYPDIVRACTEAVRRLWVTGVDPTHTVLGGDSAGGNLTLAVAMALRDGGGPAPAAMVTVSPWADLTLSGASHHTHRRFDPFAHIDDLPRMRDLALGTIDPEAASPLFGELAGLPPLLAVVGDTETLFDDSVRVVAAVQASGGHAVLSVVDGGFHTWLNHDPDLPEAVAGFAAIGEFLGSILPGGTAR